MREGPLRPAWKDAIRKLATWLPVLLILGSAIVRSASAWGDLGGYAMAGEAFRAGTYTDAASNNWPPFFSLLAVPLSHLALLPVRPARMAWAMVGCAAIAITGARFFRRLGLDGVPAWAVPAATLLVAPFWSAHLLHHQVYALVFAACAEGFFSADRGRDVRAGIWIGLAAAAKVTPGFTLIYFVFTRRLRVIAAAIATALCCSILTVPALGLSGAIDAHRRWIARAASLQGTFGDRNQSLEALILRWTVPGRSPDVAGSGPLVSLSPEAAATAGQLASALLVLVAAAACTRGRLRPVEAFAPLVAVSVFAAPYCWRSQMIALFPALLVLVARIAMRRSDRIDLAVLAVFAASVLLREAAGSHLYALVEGAGLTAIAYLVVVANSLREAASRLMPAREKSGPPALRQA